MKVHIITVAFCPAAQLARCLILWERQKLGHHFHSVVQGHYPVNKKKNNRDIEMVCDAFGIPLLDPGSDLGSAQSQNWALEQIAADDNDLFVNLDPDSDCNTMWWENTLTSRLSRLKNCGVLSCWSPQWEAFRDRLQAIPKEPEIMRAVHPTPFNLSAFRVNFVRLMGGLRQIGEKWGDLEAHVHLACERLGMWHGYHMGLTEDISGKYLQDRQLLEYKDAYMRTEGPDRFVGSYEEFLRWKYPEMLKVDSYIEQGTEFK